MEFNTDKISEIISDSAAKLKEKANETKDVIKAKYNISKLKDELDDLYIKLGKLVNDAYNYPDTVSEKDAAEINEEINAKIDDIEKATAELRKLSGKTVCPSCKKDVGDDASFCPYCGAKL